MERIRLIFFLFFLFFLHPLFSQILSFDSSFYKTIEWFNYLENQGFILSWNGTIYSENEQINISKNLLKNWNENKKNEVLKEILLPYWEAGYLLTQLNFNVDSIVGNNIYISATLNTGNKIKLEAIKWNKPPPLKEKRLMKMLNIQLDEPITSYILFLQPKTLLFDFIYLSDFPKLELVTDSTAILHLDINTKSKNNIEGMLGFAKLNSGIKNWQLNGFLKGNFIDLIGWGEQWNIFINLGTGFQNINILFGVPYVAGLPLSIQGIFRMRVQDSTYGYTNEEINFYHIDRSRRWEILFGGGQKQSTMFEKADSNLFSDYRYSYLNLGGQYSKLDNNDNPNKGFKIDIHTNIGNSVIGAKKEINDKKNQLLAETFLNVISFIPIHRNVSLYFDCLHRGVFSNKSILKNQTLLIGGINDILGIEEERITAKQLYKLESGVSLKGSQNTYIRFFYQFAHVDHYQSEWGNYQSFGISFQLKTRIGWIWTAIAIPKELNHNWDFASSRLHLKTSVYF
ncbi:MAG: hypothetical protein WBL11_02950 [Bacteroidales bacterium]|jgi:hypothetical protein|nr:hypothetical protein [Bacteroidales bacterium]MDD3755346.1 hypothetical protein [Bacteroidales bacterium]MDI9575759.1 hypothetical protein [Bacteroidota bacterium]MDY0401022.1 hypothetical protein [Bacteroidales bacterium]HHW59402.1 hypothetical protein [Bacteroidales bacterium]